MKEPLTIRVGGSNRKLHRQRESFRQAGIEIRDGGTASLGIHHSNRHWYIEDTEANRAFARSVGASIPRRQFSRKSYAF